MKRSDRELLRELALMFEQNPDAVLAAALEHGVPARSIIDSYARTLAYLRECGVQAALDAPVGELDATPPGVLDARIVFEEDLWIDLFRVPHRPSEMPSEYVRALASYLRERAAELFAVVGEGDVETWLEGTPLMRSLERRLADDRLRAGSSAAPRRVWAIDMLPRLAPDGSFDFSPMGPSPRIGGDQPVGHRGVGR